MSCWAQLGIWSLPARLSAGYSLPRACSVRPPPNAAGSDFSREHPHRERDGLAPRVRVVSPCASPRLSSLLSRLCSPSPRLASTRPSLRPRFALVSPRLHWPLASPGLKSPLASPSSRLYSPVISPLDVFSTVLAWRLSLRALNLYALRVASFFPEAETIFALLDRLDTYKPMRYRSACEDWMELSSVGFALGYFTCLSGML